MKAQVARTRVNLHKFCKGKCWDSIGIFNLLKFRTSKDILGPEKCKVTFGLRYIFDNLRELITNLHKYQTQTNPAL